MSTNNKGLNGFSISNYNKKKKTMEKKRKTEKRGQIQSLYFVLVSPVLLSRSCSCLLPIIMSSKRDTLNS